MLKKLALLGAIGALTLAVTGCDDDGGAAAPAAFLSGTAAVGAAMASSPVVVNCAGTTTNLTTTTNAAGGYSISAADATAAGAVLPCAIRVTFSAVDYFSLVQTGARANVTPLTNLVVARALAQNSLGAPAAWFTAGADLAAVSSAEVDAAVSAVKTALEAAATGTDTVAFDLFTGSLVPGSASNLYDTWLDAFQTAVGANYATMLTNFATNGTITGITITLPTTIGGGGGNGTLTITTSVAGFAGVPVTVNNTPIPAAQTDFCAAYNAVGGAGYVPGLSGITCTYNASTRTGTVRGTLTQGISISYVITYRWTVAAAAAA